MVKADRKMGGESSAPTNGPRRLGRTLRRRFAAQVSQLEKRELLAKLGADAPIPLKLDSVQSLSAAQIYDQPQQVGNVPPIPLILVTIRNYSDDTVYPIIKAENATQDMAEPGLKALFDIFDNYNEDYRGYIGYQDGGTNYIGLRPHTEVTVSMPLVFWDSGRIIIATAGDLIQQENNIYNYRDDSLRFTTDSDNFRNAPDGGGIVQWFHYLSNRNDPKHSNSGAIGIPDDAPGQLLELTIRNEWMGNLPNWQHIHVQAKIDAPFTSLNYDVSYVDAIMLPASMEATDPIVDFLKPGDEHYREPFGWAGANLTVDKLQGGQNTPGEIAKFANNTAGQGFPDGYLGNYFGGLGWDEYFAPNNVPGINLPAGHHLFMNSPLNDARSAFSSGNYMLASGGKVYVQPLNNGFPVAKPGTTTDQSDQLTGLDPEMVKLLAPGMLINDNSGANPAISQSTTILKINPDGTSVTMSQKATSSQTRNYVFQGSILTGKLKTAPNNDKKLIAVDGADAAFIAQLQVGMLISGDGVPAGLRIKTISPDNKFLILDGDVPDAPRGQKYTFSGGVADPFISKLTSLWYGWANYYAKKFSKPMIPGFELANGFDLVPNNTSFGDKFAAIIYDVMSAFSAITPNGSRLTTANFIMSNIIGDNVGMIPGLSPERRQQLTDEVISLMRGVLDHTERTTEKDWYSPPTDTRQYGGAKIGKDPADYNVYNLNPYVWFVKKKLGLSGYAFSVDDGISDVDARGATKMIIGIGGTKDPKPSSKLKDLPNQLPYGPYTHWGPVKVLARQIPESTSPNTIQIAKDSDRWELGLLSAKATVTAPADDIFLPGTIVNGFNDREFWVVLNPSKKMKRKSGTFGVKFYDPVVITS